MAARERKKQEEEKRKREEAKKEKQELKRRRREEREKQLAEQSAKELTDDLQTETGMCRHKFNTCMSSGHSALLYT